MVKKRRSFVKDTLFTPFKIKMFNIQVLESEKKLRISSLLGLKSARYGEIKYHPSSDIEDNVPTQRYRR